MLNSIKITLKRDVLMHLQHRLFWWCMVISSLLCIIVYFAFIQDFLNIQPSLRAKSAQYGVTDLALIPYIRTLGSISLILMASLCSRLFHQEHFTTFSALLRSTQPDFCAIICAKLIYLSSLSFIIVLLIAHPVVISAYFFDYTLSRILITLLAQFVLLFSTGLLSAVFSQVFKHSILVVLMVITVFLFTTLAARVIVEPAWLAPIIDYFSPLAHMERIATGVITVSDGIFFIFLWLLLSFIALRQFRNTYWVSVT